MTMRRSPVPSRRKQNNAPDRPNGRIARLLLSFGTVAVCIALAVGGLSGEQMLDIGRRMALLSVGMMQPEGGAEALSGRLDRVPAANSGKEQTESVDGPTVPYTPGSGNQEGVDLPTGGDAVIPPNAGDGGSITEEQLTMGSSFVQGVAIKNASSATINIAEQIAVAPALGLTNTAEPQVLIVHTHTTEGYMSYDAGYYNAADLSRTKDNSRNVVNVGEAIAAQLRAAGIGVIHDITIHDNPKYTGAYDRSAATIQKNLKTYPTIRVVLDIHRDAIYRSSANRLKPTAVINGRKAAQMMVIASACDSSSQPHPNWPENLRLALRLQSALHTQYEGIVRPLYLVDSRYNQHLTKGSLLIEVGTDGNTVEEASYSGQILGKTLAQVLNSLKEE